MFCMNILLFLAVFVSSTSKSSTTPIRNGAFSGGRKPAQQLAEQLEQDTRVLQYLPPLAISRRGTSRDSLTPSDDTTGVQKSSSHARQISIRSVSNGNETSVLNEHVFKNGSDDQILCEHRLDGFSGTLSSYQMEESASCRWNLSAPNDFSITVVLAVLRYNDSSLALADSAGDPCLPNGTRVVFTEFLPDFQPKQIAFCEVKSAQIVAFSFTTLGNKVSIDVYNQRGSQIVWALWYQAIDESSFVEVPYDVIGSAGVITELSTSNYDLLGKWSGKSADQCFEFSGTTIKPKEGAVGNNGSCSMTFSPDLNQEMMLSFLNTDLLGPTVTNCSYEHAFIIVRTWNPDGNINETFLCSIPSMGAQFTSPVRIELNYHPSTLTLHDFTAKISSAIPDLKMGGAELLRLLLQNTLVYSLTDERGLLATLDYPSQFPGTRMIWEITVGKGKAINLEFVDIDLGYTPPTTCNATTPIFVIILSPSLGEQHIYCGSLPPRNITSTGNKMIIIFDPRSSVRGVGNGIQAAYTSFDNQNNTFQGNLDVNDVWMQLPELPIPSSLLDSATTVLADCQFLFMKDSGNFTTLDYPIDSPVNYTTCWHILSGPSEFIKNLFTNFPLLDFYDEGGGVHGAYPGLFATSFPDENDTFRANFDIDDGVTPAVPFSREPTVSFSREPTASFSTEPTASISTDQTVSFPTEPTATSSTVNGAGYDEGSGVQGAYPGLFATSFPDENDKFRANFDIDDGVTPAVPFSREPTVSFSREPTASFSREPTASFSTEPTASISTDQTVSFPTEPTATSTTVTGASIVFAECTHIITEDSGNFTTLYYPNDYPANYTSCWYVSTDPSRFIMLRFRNFSLDSAQVDPCDRGYSFVTINDFVAETVDLCGTLENQLFKSSSNKVKININGRLGRGHGFYAIYETFKIPLYRSHVAEGNAGSCNATEHLERLTVSGNVRLPALMSKCTVDGNWLEWFTETEKESGWFASPLFPGRYPAGSHCRWIVRAEENMMVNLNFFDFDLGEAQGTYPPCGEADTFILIRDCVSGEEQIVCGIRTETEQLLIQSNSVEIEFYSGNGNGKGFQAFYNLRQSYVDGQQYRVLPENPTPSPGYRENPAMTTQEPLPPQPLMSTLPSEVDTVPTNPLCEDAGSDKCGGNLQSEFGYFSSAFYPKEFQSNTNCIWTITSSLRDHQIALKILDIDLGAPVMNGECEARYGYLKVDISGHSTFICNNHGQNLFVSDAGLIRLEFSSEYSIGRGFCAAFMSIGPSFNVTVSDLHFPCLCDNLYTNISSITPLEPTEPKSCEFIIGEGSGILPSESFPIPYPPNSECVWTLLAELGEYVNLHFLSLDLDRFRMSRRRRCLLSDTHVQITLFKETQVFNKRFCSDDDWSVTIPSSRDVTVKFISGDIPDHNYTGFRMAYNFTRTSSSEVFRQDLPENTSVSESSEENFGFRVFNDYDGYSSFSSADFPDEEVVVETGRRTTEGDRTRLVWPIEVETDIPDLGLFTDYATVIPDVYGTELPGEPTTTIDVEADILTTSSMSERPHKTYPSSELTTTSLTSTTSGVIPAKGQMTAREMELTIYICTGLAAFLIVVLILVTLYCAKNRRSNSKDGFNVDAAEEANYWQTYKDWAKDYVTEPVAGSAQSTVGAMYGDEGGMAPKRVPTSGDAMAAAESSPGHIKTVSAVVNQLPMDKPERNFIPSEKLV